MKRAIFSVLLIALVSVVLYAYTQPAPTSNLVTCRLFQYIETTALVQQSTIQGLSGYVVFQGSANQLTFVNSGTYYGYLSDP